LWRSSIVNAYRPAAAWPASSSTAPSATWGRSASTACPRGDGGATPKTGKCRIQAIEVNGPVVINRVQILPGDLIIADDSGICAVPPEHAEYVLH
jgi:hypothetical protein